MHNKPLLLTLVVLCGVVLLTSFTVNAQDRVVTFNNYCDFPVWFGFLSGATDMADKCGNCPTGSYCDSSNNNCYWNIPTPDNGNYKLLPNTSNTATIRFYDNGRSPLWSGAIAGRTGCVDGQKCTTADCSTTNHDTEACKTGFAQPATQAEFTFLKQDVDTYDVEIINGISIPVEIVAEVTGNFTGYDCGNPGGFTPVNSELAACQWEFTEPSPYYVWVEAGGANCATDNDCTAADERCGLHAKSNGNEQLTCGKQLGYYSADEVCGENNAFGAPFDCAANTDLYGCIGQWKDSCYTNGAQTGCCGCVDWATLGVKLPNTTTLCKATSNTWNTQAQPKLEWMKKGCPTLYTYPFDDPSSTFTCKQMNGNGYNTVNYQVNFCHLSTNNLPNNNNNNNNNSPAAALRPVWQDLL